MVKQGLYPQVRDFRLQDDMLAAFIKQYIASVDLPEVGLIRQRGEPTLLGGECCRQVIDLQRAQAKGRRIANSLPTNSKLLDGERCEILALNRFLVGPSLYCLDDEAQDIVDTFSVHDIVDKSSLTIE